MSKSSPPQETEQYRLVHTGSVVHYSKEYLRQIFIANGYFARLEAARAAGEPEPDYPDFTPEQIAGVSRRFTIVAETYPAAVDSILN